MIIQLKLYRLQISPWEPCKISEYEHMRIQLKLFLAERIQIAVRASQVLAMRTTFLTCNLSVKYVHSLTGAYPSKYNIIL